MESDGYYGAEDRLILTWSGIFYMNDLTYGNGPARRTATEKGDAFLKRPLAM